MGKFVVKTTANGGFKFDLKAGNGEIIASSQIYKSEKSCNAGIESVRNNCTAEVEDQTVENFEVKKHPKYEMYTDKAGEIRFRLKAKNGEIIATSEGYKKKASALNGIESVKKNAPDANVVNCHRGQSPFSIFSYTCFSSDDLGFFIKLNTTARHAERIAGWRMFFTNSKVKAV